MTSPRASLPATNSLPEVTRMAGRRSPVTDIRELLRRLQLGEPDRRVARDLEISRNTVARYREWATEQKLLPGALPDPAALAALLQPAPTERPAHEQLLVEPFREQVTVLHERGVEGQAIWQLLVEQHDFAGCPSPKPHPTRLTPTAALVRSQGTRGGCRQGSEAGPLGPSDAREKEVERDGERLD